MTQYILKKDTFGIPAGTIARKANNMDCYELPSPSGYNVFLENEVVENGSDFEKVEEPKKEGSMYSTAADCSRVTVSCEGGAKYEVYAEAWGDFIEEHALVDDEPEKELPKKLARATFFYDNACEEPTNPTALFSSYDEACEHASCYSDKVVKIIWPARFDDEGYLIMEVE